MYRQRKFGIRTSFEFDDERFSYGFGDVFTLRRQSIDYAVLNLSDCGEFAIANNAYVLRWVPLVWLLGWIILASIEVPSLWGFEMGGVFGSLLLGSLLVVGVFAVAMTLELAQVTFTEIPTFDADDNGARGFVRIIRDKHHDTILDDLRRHWLQRMRALHSFINTSAGREAEIARLAFLSQHGIVSANEHQAMVDALDDALAAIGMDGRVTH